MPPDKSHPLFPSNPPLKNIYIIYVSMCECVYGWIDGLHTYARTVSGKIKFLNSQTKNTSSVWTQGTS